MNDTSPVSLENPIETELVHSVLVPSCMNSAGNTHGEEEECDDMLDFVTVFVIRNPRLSLWDQSKERCEDQ